MSTFQNKRGTSTQNDAFTGANGEITFDTTNKTLRAHDGSQAGGFSMYRVGGTDVALADGGTGASNAADARTNLGLGSAATFDEATAAQFRNNTANKTLSTDAVWDAAAEVGLSDAATIAVDMSSFINASVTLGGNRTLGQPSNTKVGQTGVIRILQPGSGGPWTLAYHADWEFAGGTAPVLSTAANAQDLLFYQVLANNKIFGSLIKDVK